MPPLSWCVYLFVILVVPLDSVPVSLELAEAPTSWPASPERLGPTGRLPIARAVLPVFRSLVRRAKMSSSAELSAPSTFNSKNLDFLFTARSLSEGAPNSVCRFDCRFDFRFASIFAWSTVRSSGEDVRNQTDHRPKLLKNWLIRRRQLGEIPWPQSIVFAP